MEISFKTSLPEKEDLYALYEHLGWNDFLKLDQEALIKAMEGSYLSVYAYCEGRLIATGRIVSDGVINAYLCGLGVHSQFRGRGIATEIIKILVDNCREKGLHIQFFCEEELVPFYEKAGFDRFAAGMRFCEYRRMMGVER